MNERPEATVTTKLLEIIDSTVQQRALIFGSLPPTGRDIDLLVTAADAQAVASRLASEGFVPCGKQWVLFRGCAVSMIELVSTDVWHLPSHELAALFSDGVPLEGMKSVVAPAPHHILLLLARRLRSKGARVGPRQRARIEQALSSNPNAWELARNRADAWGVNATLERLESVYSREGDDGRRKRLRRPGRTRIVSLSGLDGAGKSSQARSLRDALDRLGFCAVAEWAPSYELNLGFIASPARRLLHLRQRSTAGPHVSPDFRPSSYPAVVAHVWVALQAVVTTLSLWRALGRHIGRGRVVILDRYALDAAVFLRYRHGADRDFRFQIWLMRALSPKPLCSYLLDVSGETAIRRKEDQYAVEELLRQAELYRQEAAAFGVRRLDGERAEGELCEAIATEAWRKLKGLPAAGLPVANETAPIGEGHE
jgi:thymidylate kinase